MKKLIAAKIQVKPGKLQEFIPFIQDIVEKSREESGNISYTFYQDLFEENALLVFEEWKNQAAIDFHFSTEHFRIYGKAKEQYVISSDIAIYTIEDERKV